MGIDLIVNSTLALAQNSTGVTLGSPDDQQFTQQGGLYQMPGDKRLIAMCAVVPDPVRIQIDTPTLRRVVLPTIDLINPSLPLANRPAIWWAGPQGIGLKSTEEYRLLASRAGAAAGDVFVASWLADAAPVARPGQAVQMYFTSAIATTAGNWKAGGLTPEIRLPQGRYDVIGIQTYGANCFASRLLFTPNLNRPGNICRSSIGTWNGEDWRNGRQGVLGSFTNTTIPQLEVFAHGNTGTQVTILDVVPYLS